MLQVEMGQVHFMITQDDTEFLLDVKTWCVTCAF